MRFLADEDFDNRILRGLFRRVPELDLVRVQDTEVSGAADPDVLQWAAREARVLLTHDTNTMIQHFRNHVASGYDSPGVILVRQSMPVSAAIDALTLVVQYSIDGEYQNQVRFLPLP